MVGVLKCFFYRYSLGYYSNIRLMISDLHLWSHRLCKAIDKEDLSCGMLSSPHALASLWNSTTVVIGFGYITLCEIYLGEETPPP